MQVRNLSLQGEFKNCKSTTHLLETKYDLDDSTLSLKWMHPHELENKTAIHLAFALDEEATISRVCIKRATDSDPQVEAYGLCGSYRGCQGARVRCQIDVTLGNGTNISVKGSHLCLHHMQEFFHGLEQPMCWVA